MGFMKLEDAVRHLASLRLALKMPDGKLHPLSKKLRRPRGVIPLIEAKDGLISKQEGDDSTNSSCLSQGPLTHNAD